MMVETDKRVKEFIKRLSEFDQGRILRYLNLFDKYGFSLPAKYLKKLDSNLWELRPGNIRLLFGKSTKSDKLILVHVFKKQTNKTPKKHLETAKLRLKEY